MGARIRSILRAALLVAAALEATYLLGAHLVLNTSLGTRLFNRRPERFHVGWTVAVTPWPGWVHLRGVETGGMSRTIQWRARVASVSASFRVRPLFDRVVDLGEVRARGIEYAQRPRLDPGVAPPPEAEEWPVFEGVANPPTGTGAGIGPPRPPGPAWTVRAARIRGTTGEIWIGRYRLAGEADLDAALDLVARGPIALPRLDYRLTRGELFAGRDAIFEGMSLTIAGRLEPFTPRGRAAGDVIRALSGTYELEARDGSLRFLEVYFRKAPGLRLDGGGPMKLTMILDHGRLQQGSVLERSADRIDTTFLGTRVTGTGTIRADVRLLDGVPTSWVEALIDRYDVTRAGSDVAHAHGRGFHVVVTSTSLDLADPFEDVHLLVELPEAEIHDLTVYNDYLPADCRLRITRGAGHLTYRFEGDSNERSLHGRMKFAMQDLALQFEETTLTGDIVVDTRLRSGEPREKRFDIGGTTITLRHRKPAWRGRIALPAATLVFAEPMRLDARVALDLQDTLPLVTVFDAYRDLPRIVERLMTIENVRGGARLRSGGEGVAVRDLAIEGDGFRALAELNLGRAGREGILYFRLHGFSVGVHLVRGEKQDLKLWRPLAWYEKERAARRSARPQ